MISSASGFSIGSSDAIDDRLVLTKAQMKSANDNVFPDVYMCVCSDDGNIYTYNKTNEIDETTGKFRIFESGGGLPEPESKDKLLLSSENETTSELEWKQVDKSEVGSTEWTGTKAEWEALSTEEKAQFDGKKVNITDDVQDEISGMKLLWTNPNPNDAFNAQTVTFEKNDYKAYLINAKLDETGEHYVTATVFVGYGSEFVYFGGSGGPTTGNLFNMSRIITASSDNSVTFENMAQWFKTEPYTANQKRMVPYQIYGIK